MLDAFKIKPYELEPVFAEWTDGPIFTGDPKKDLSVNEWLEQIKAGCAERKIPEECWHKVAQHFMGAQAKARLTELKAVIAQVHGGQYRWSWKKFKIAMQNMGWDIDPTKTQTIKVSKHTGSWWSLRKKEEPAANADTPPRSVPSRSSSMLKMCSNDEVEVPLVAPPPLDKAKKVSDAKEVPVPTRRPPTRSSSDFWPMRKKEEEPEEISTEQRRMPGRSKTDIDVPPTRETTKRQTRSNTVSTDSVTTVSQAPVWLLNAFSALEYITSEHPKTMSIISAILITAGTIPAIPAVSAGAAVQAIGAIAVGLGQALSSAKAPQAKQTESSTAVR